MPKRKKRRGHYCWACERRRPNETFSGRGHAKHVCRECAKLGGKELAYRQNLRDLQRCISFEGIIRREQRAVFQRFLHHEDPRIRAMAEDMHREDQENRELARALWEAEESADDVVSFHSPTDDHDPF